MLNKIRCWLIQKLSNDMPVMLNMTLHRTSTDGLFYCPGDIKCGLICNNVFIEAVGQFTCYPSKTKEINNGSRIL